MTYLLIAIYLLDGSIEPLASTKLFPDKPACQSAASRYLASQVTGSKWTICKKLKQPSKGETK